MPPNDLTDLDIEACLHLEEARDLLGRAIAAITGGQPKSVSRGLVNDAVYLATTAGPMLRDGPIVGVRTQE